MYRNIDSRSPGAVLLNELIDAERRRLRWTLTGRLEWTVFANEVVSA